MRHLARRYCAGLSVLLTVPLSGCDRSGGTAPAATTAAATVPAGPGVIAGVVRFSGARPDPMQAPGECCPGVPAPADETVAVNPDGTLANVTVYVDHGPDVAGPPPAPALLAQRGCRYVPHVLALRVGQKLVVTNGDPTLHNVHVTSGAPANPSMNVGQFQGGAQPMTFVAPDDDVEFKCDNHPWMRAHAMVFDHPCYAVTAAGGTFRIDRLPPGTYTLVAHQEEFADLTQTVTITADRPTADVTFDYHP